MFNNHSVITSSTFFVSLLLAFSVPAISAESSATGCGLFLLNKNLVQRGSSKSPSNVCSQWWGCIRTPGACAQLSCFPTLRWRLLLSHPYKSMWIPSVLQDALDSWFYLWFLGTLPLKFMASGWEVMSFSWLTSGSFTDVFSLFKQDLYLLLCKQKRIAISLLYWA